jgi:hypothetical protein
VSEQAPGDVSGAHPEDRPVAIAAPASGPFDRAQEAGGYGDAVEDYLVALDQRDRMHFTVAVTGLLEPVVSATAAPAVASDFSSLLRAFGSAARAEDRNELGRVAGQVERLVLPTEDEPVSPLDIAFGLDERGELQETLAAWVRQAFLALFAACSVLDDVYPDSFMDCCFAVTDVLAGMDEVAGTGTAPRLRDAAAASLAPARDGDPQLRLRRAGEGRLREVATAVTEAAGRLPRMPSPHL